MEKELTQEEIAQRARELARRVLTSPPQPRKRGERGAAETTPRLSPEQRDQGHKSEKDLG